MMPARTFNVVDRRCRGFGALPPPLAGEGWERGDCAFRRIATASASTFSADTVVSQSMQPSVMLCP